MTDNIDSELLNQQSLFQGLTFFIPVNEHDRINLISLITTFNGNIENNPLLAQFYLSSDINIKQQLLNSSTKQLSPQFVIDSVNKKELQNISDYLINSDSDTNNDTNNNNNNNSNISHDITNDINSNTSNNNHNHNSNDNSDNGDNSDKVQESLQLLAESNNISIPMPTEQETSMTSQMSTHSNTKNGFTPEEDAFILDEVRKNPHRRSTHQLFKEIAIKLGKHTGNSIRYRFRTHLASSLNYVYKVDSNGILQLDENKNLIVSNELPPTVKNKFTADDDYLLAKEVKKRLSLLNSSNGNDNSIIDSKPIPLPGKFFEELQENYPHHTKAAWRDRYRKFIVPYGLENYIKYYEEQKSQNLQPDEIKNFTGKNLYKSSKKFRQTSIGLDDNNSNSNDLVGETLNQFNNSEDNELNKMKKRKIDSNSDLSNNLFATSEEQAIAAATETAQSDNPDRINPKILNGDLVTSKFLEFQSISSIVSKLDEIVNRNFDSGDAEELLLALYKECGIQKSFGYQIITTVCGDLILIPKYINMFLRTGENPPQNVHGIWTERDDNYLKSNLPERLEYLKKLHGSKRIELRKSFINNEYI